MHKFSTSHYFKVNAVIICQLFCLVTQTTKCERLPWLASYQFFNYPDSIIFLRFLCHLKIIKMYIGPILDNYPRFDAGLHSFKWNDLKTRGWKSVSIYTYF